MEADEILKEVANGRRLASEEALILAKEASVHALGEAGLSERGKRHGNKAYYVYNQHVNYTSVCKNACRFCAFAKRIGMEGAYTRSVTQIVEDIKQKESVPIREIHIVGGLNPAIPYDYYLNLLKELRRARPTASLKAFTAVEIAFLADKYGLGDERVLSDFKSAGLDALPGGGAEVFSAELRQKICPEKISAKRWLDVHEIAHSLGIPTNATMIFGHIETWRERIEHLEALRSLQDKAPGFFCFIPLCYQPGGNPLAKDGAKGPGGVDVLKLIAISRIYLDNFRHIKAYWPFMGIKTAQVALHAGADDFDGTIVEERIGHAAGADTPKGLSITKLKEAITQAGFEPVERNSFFEEIEAMRG